MLYAPYVISCVLSTCILASTAFAQDRLKIATVIPSAISERDLVWYRQIVGLTEAQMKYVASIHATYAANYGDRVQQAMKEMAPLSHAVSKGYAQALYDQTFKVARNGFLEVERACLADLERMDAGFLAAIDLVLADAQRTSMQRVLWHRDRQRCAKSEWDMYSARVDLIAVIEQLNPQPYEWDAMRTSLEAYESAITPVMVELHASSMRSRQRLMSLVVDSLFAPDNTPWPADSQEAAHMRNNRELERNRLLQSNATLQKRCSDINHQHLTTIGQALPDRLQFRFHQEVRRQSYPYAVYPDRSDPADVCRRLLEHSEGEARTLAEQEYTKYRQRYEHICNSMAALFDDRRLTKARTRGVADYQPYQQAMTKLRDQRWLINETIVKQLFAMLPEEVQSEVGPVYEDYLRVLSSDQQTLLSRDWPGP